MDLWIYGPMDLWIYGSMDIWMRTAPLGHEEPAAGANACTSSRPGNIDSIKGLDEVFTAAILLALSVERPRLPSADGIRPSTSVWVERSEEGTPKTPFGATAIVRGVGMERRGGGEGGMGGRCG